MALDISDGERDVLSRIANGFKRKEAANDLRVSLSTINNRLYEARERTGCRTVEHLLAWYVREEVVKQFKGAPEEPAAT